MKGAKLRIGKPVLVSEFYSSDGWKETNYREEKKLYTVGEETEKGIKHTADVKSQQATGSDVAFLTPDGRRIENAGEFFDEKDNEDVWEYLEEIAEHVSFGQKWMRIYFYKHARKIPALYTGADIYPRTLEEPDKVVDTDELEVEKYPRIDDMVYLRKEIGD